MGEEEKEPKERGGTNVPESAFVNLDEKPKFESDDD